MLKKLDIYGHVMTRNSIYNLKAIASQVRRDIVRIVHASQSGHLGASLGCIELLVALYFEVMVRHEEFDLEGHGEDLFFLSNGHISPVFYSVLARVGYFPLEERATFREIDARLQGHATAREGLLGIPAVSGSLGQVFSVAIRAAQIKKLNQDDHLVYVLMGNGELQEGQIWEAALYAPPNQLDNLIAIVDYNDVQIDGATEAALSWGDLHAKWSAFGWKVIEVKRGNNMTLVVEGLHHAKETAKKGVPVVIILNTEMGNDVDFRMGSDNWHGVAPNDEQLTSALAQNMETLGDY